MSVRQIRGACALGVYLLVMRLEPDAARTAAHR
jgi:hypothetical protein